MKTISFSSMADFKRKAMTGRYMKGSYYNKPQADEWRKIGKTQSNGLYLLQERKTGSWFMFPKAKDVEIMDDKLKIYEDRAIVGGNDIPANTSWLKYDLETGKIKESEITYYRTQIAEYVLGEEML